MCNTYSGKECALCGLPNALDGEFCVRCKDTFAASKLERALEVNRELVKALEFYADRRNNYDTCGPIGMDRVARKALSLANNETEISNG